jgi:hypothetical protein
MREAASILGVSHAKMWQLVREELLPTEQNPLDRRQKLIRVSDLEELKRPRSQPRLATKSPEADDGTQGGAIHNGLESGRPGTKFISDGIGSNPDGPDAATVKDWIRATWQRDE